MPWRLVLWRPNVVIYAREGYGEHVPRVDLMAQVRQEMTVPSEVQVAEIISMPAPSATATWWSGFFRRQNYPEAIFSMAYFADQNDHLPAASSLYSEAIRRSHGRYPEIYLNLGLLFERHGLEDLARTCFAAAD
jgi:disulfide oxidoreductase YuzD